MPRTRATTCAAAIVSAVLAVTAAGCGGGKSDDQSTSSRPVTLTQGKDFRFAMVTHGDAGSFWTVVKRGAQQAGKDLGIKLDYQESVNDPQSRRR